MPIACINNFTVAFDGAIEAEATHRSRTLLAVSQKVQKIAIELLGSLQESKMAYARQEEQSGIWDFIRHEFNIFALDCFIMIAVND